jgi:hypothetical protein
MGFAGLMQTQLCADPIVSGALTGTAIFDVATSSFVAFDVRGNAVVQDPAGQLQITDSLASPTFGNLQLVVGNVPDDGSSLFLNFDPLSLALNFPLVNETATGAIAVGTPSAAQVAFLNPQSFQFTVTSVTPFTATQFALGLVTSTSAVPEPVASSLVGLGLISLALVRHRRARRRS